MYKRLKKIIKIIERLGQDDTGSVAAYVAGFSILVLGLGAVSVDVGRLSVVQTQMQNRADAGALAGAAQLDSQEGARARATNMAMNASRSDSMFTTGGSELGVQAVTFYQAIEPDLVLADSDENAKFIRVSMAPKTMNYIFRPLSVGVDAPDSATMNAEAIAKPEPFMCHAPPLMICDLGENDPTIDLNSTDVIGRQVVLKPANGGDAWAPGNYGLLALPDGSIGASALEAALAAVQPADCYGIEIGTAPGVKTNKVQSGINARFGVDTSWSEPAPNVINYPQDEDVAAETEDVLGNGTWDLATYWSDKHDTPLPDDLIDATRYQVYLYELGETFARNGTRTIFPIDGDLPDGFVEVTPAASDIPTSTDHPDDPDYDGVPSEAVASNGASRRIVQVAILNCIADEVRGSHNYPSTGKYLEMFITQAVSDAPAGGIYGEIVRPLTLTTTPDFHANVKLVR